MRTEDSPVTFIQHRMKTILRFKKRSNAKIITYALAFCYFFILLSTKQSNAQSTLSLQLTEQNGITSIAAGGEYHIQLSYSVSSTTSVLTGLKAIVNLPVNIFDVRDFTGNSDVPASGFVYNAAAHTLTIAFKSPLPSGSNGVLVFGVLTNNLVTPNNTVLTSTAVLSDANGNNSGIKSQSITVTAAANLCAYQTFNGGGAINYPTSYKFNINYGNGLFAPLGTLEATHVSLVDTLPAGTSFIGVSVTNPSTGGGPVIYSVSNNNAVVTISLPDMDYNPSWLDANTYEVILTVQYNAPAFLAGSKVVNNAVLNYTPFGGTAAKLADGLSVHGECTAALKITNTLAPAKIDAQINKYAYSPSLNIYPGGGFTYAIDFKNTGNVPLNDVSIIDNIPSNMRIDPTAEYAGIRIDGWHSLVDHGEYKSNLHANWVVLPKAPYGNFPVLPAGEYYTAIKLVLINPVPANVKLEGYNLLHFVPSSGNITSPIGVSNCLTWTSSMPGIPDTAARTACDGNFTLMPRPSTSKIVYDATATPSCSSAVAVGTEATFTAIVSADPGYADASNPLVAMMIPHGFAFNSFSFDPKSSGLTILPKLETTVNNYMQVSGVQYDMYRFTFPKGTVLTYGSKMSISINTTVTASLTGNLGYVGLVVATASNASISQPANFAGNFIDNKDWNMNGNYTEYSNYVSTSNTSCSISVIATTSMVAIQWIKGSMDNDYSQYPRHGESIAGGQAKYKLTVKNNGNIPMKSISVLDIFPFVGDAGVIDPSPRNSKWRPNLMGTINAPTGAKVYYSTSKNPCRDPNSLNITNGCTDWSLLPPANITNVQSILIDFGAIVLSGGDSLNFSWNMSIPNTIQPDSAIAWNSFAFTGIRTDNNQPLLPAEPIKVGVLLVNIILPVDWLGFNVNRNNDKVELHWSVANANEVKKIILQKSADNYNWDNFSTISNAAGLSNFSVTDAKPFLGINYYRILRLDNSDKLNYSVTQIVDFSSTSQITVWPNPVLNTLYVQTNNTSNKDINAIIFDVLGEKVKTIVLHAGNNTVNLSSLHAGIYFMHVMDSSGKSDVQKIIKK